MSIRGIGQRVQMIGRQLPAGPRIVTAYSAWTKSHASTVAAWVQRNCRQVVQLRCGAGGIRGRLSTRRTVEAPIRMRRPSISPWIRL
jgi:hypothetical protein